MSYFPADLPTATEPFLRASSRAAMDSIPLWSSLILVDPILIPPLDVDPSGGMLKPLSGAVSRRTRWPSK